MAEESNGNGRTLAALEARVEGLTAELNLVRSRQGIPWLQLALVLIALTGLICAGMGQFTNLSINPVWQQVNTNQADLTLLKTQIVPRGENEEHWHGIDAKFADAQRQLDSLDTKLGSTYSLRDIILQLQDEVRRLRDREAARAGTE